MLSDDRKKKKGFFFFTIFLGVVLLVLFLFFFLDQFRLKKITVISEYLNIYGLEIVDRQNLLFLDTAKLKKNLIRRNPSLLSVLIVKSYPDKLLISLHFRKPVANVANNSVKLYIDKEGVLLPFLKKDLNLPTIRATSTSFSFNHKADWRIVKATALLTNIQKKNIFVEQIVIDDEAKVFLIHLKDNTQVIVPYNSATRKVAASLQTIIARFRIEGKFIAKIDFRFDKPVVTFSN